MFLKTCLLLTAFFSFASMASTLKIEYGFNAYSFEIKENVITYTKKSHRSSVERRDCSKNLFQKFSVTLNALTTSLPMNEKETIKKDGTEFAVRYHFENKKGELRHDSSLGKRLLLLPNDFETLRLAVDIRCEAADK